MKGIEMLILMLDNRACHSHMEYWSLEWLQIFCLIIESGSWYSEVTFPARAMYFGVEINPSH